MNRTLIRSNNYTGTEEGGGGGGEKQESLCPMEESVKVRARLLLSQVASLPPHKLNPSSRARLLKMVRAELRFLDRISGSPKASSALNSTNLGYLEAVVRVLHHPSVDAVSAVFHSFPLPQSTQTPSSHTEVSEVHVDIVCTFEAKPVWIIVSDRNPKYLNWLDPCSRLTGWKFRTELLIKAATQVISVLQPVAVLFCFAKGVSTNLARGFATEFCASWVEMFGLQEVDHSKSGCLGLLRDSSEWSYESDDEDWVYIQSPQEQAASNQPLQNPMPMVTVSRTSEHWATLRIEISIPLDQAQAISHGDLYRGKVLKQDLLVNEILPLKDEGSRNDCQKEKSQFQGQEENLTEEAADGFLYVFRDCNEPFISFLSAVGLQGNKLKDAANSDLGSSMVNLDTTALIATVSEASNGAASMIVTMDNEELEHRFGNTAQFMRDQAEEELKNPLLKVMKGILKDRKPFISQTVYLEFKSLVSLCGGSREKKRAEELLKLLLVYPDTPSVRVMSLCETGKIKEKNKIIFGTGDSVHAPTLTANLSFVRAVQQTGMALSVIEHQPRALVGDKCN